MTPSVDYQKNGTIKVRVGDILHTLKVPNFGQFRRIKNVALHVQEVVNEKREELGIAPDNDAAINNHPELIDISCDALGDAVGMVFSELSDQKLPGEIDEWPTWLVLKTDLIGDFINHWRKTPLG